MDIILQVAKMLVSVILLSMSNNELRDSKRSPVVKELLENSTKFLNDQFKK